MYLYIYFDFNYYFDFIMLFLLLILVFIPLINFISIWFLEILGGKRVAIWTVAHTYIIIVILGFISLKKVSSNSFKFITLGSWIKCGLFVVNWGFIFDTLSVSMLLMVGIVSGAVHYYSIGYMESDPSLVRFISYLSLFTFFMFILVTSDNFVQLFLGWEGIGLCSYLLISFWNTRVQANKSALKALIVNRIGDFGFLCGLILVFYFFRSVDFSVVFVLSSFFINTTFSFLGYEFFCLNLICFFLFIGSMGKSAQIGLHVWLPDAMEAPTPVSALIHAATLVTAGIFLIIRCSPLFEFASSVLFIILFMGGLTAFIAATIALTQDDIKKVIAYSTCSQLGYMVFICGLSAYNVSLFHLINHAFFKALLFLGAGSVIHAMLGEQDMRKFGSLINLIPYTYGLMLVAFFALAGFPFLSGFYSKDLILEIAFSKYNIGGTFTYWLGTLTAFLTAFYSFRVVYYTFWGPNSSFKYYVQNVHELPNTMGFALGILSIGSLFSGYFLKDAFVGIGTLFWGNSIFILENNTIGLDFEFIPLSVKNTPLFFSLIGIFLAIIWNFICEKLNGISKFCWFFVWFKTKNSYQVKQNSILTIEFYRFLNHKWYFDFIYNYYLGYTILFHSYNSFYALLDKGLIEILCSQGLTNVVWKVSICLSRKQLGFIYHSASLLAISLLMLMSLILIF